MVIAGSMSAAGDYLMLPLQLAVKKYALNLASADTTIVNSTLGERAGALGICMLARQKLFGVTPEFS